MMELRSGICMVMEAMMIRLLMGPIICIDRCGNILDIKPKLVPVDVCIYYYLLAMLAFPKDNAMLKTYHNLGLVVLRKSSENPMKAVWMGLQRTPLW